MTFTRRWAGPTGLVLAVSMIWASPSSAESPATACKTGRTECRSTSPHCPATQHQGGELPACPLSFPLLIKMPFLGGELVNRTHANPSPGTIGLRDCNWQVACRGSSDSAAGCRTESKASVDPLGVIGIEMCFVSDGKSCCPAECSDVATEAASNGGPAKHCTGTKACATHSACAKSHTCSTTGDATKVNACVTGKHGANGQACATKKAAPEECACGPACGCCATTTLIVGPRPWPPIMPWGPLPHDGHHPLAIVGPHPPAMVGPAVPGRCPMNGHLGLLVEALTQKAALEARLQVHEQLAEQMTSLGAENAKLKAHSEMVGELMAQQEKHAQQQREHWEQLRSMSQEKTEALAQAAVEKARLEAALELAEAQQELMGDYVEAQLEMVHELAKYKVEAASAEQQLKALEQLRAENAKLKGQLAELRGAGHPSAHRISTLPEGANGQK